MATEEKEGTLSPPEVGSVADLDIPAEGTRTSAEKDSLLGMLARKRHPGLYEDDEEESPEGFTPAAEEKVEAGAEGVVPPPEKPEKGKVPEAPEVEASKFKTEEAEKKSYAEAERRMHEAIAKEKAEREAREAAERERDELRQKLAEKEKPPEPPPPPVKTKEELDAEAEERVFQTFQEIAQLDQDDDDYQRKLAKAWAKVGVGGAGQPAIPDSKALEEIVDRRLEAREAARQKARDEEAQKAAEKQQVAGIMKQAYDLAAKAGLQMDDPRSLDFLAFEDSRRTLPEEYDTKPLQEQVDWVVADVKQRIATRMEGIKAAEKKAREAQKDNAVMGKGGSYTPSKEPQEEAYTLGGILKQQRLARQQGKA